MAAFSKTDFNDRSIVVDLYDVSDCGKTYILNQLKKEFEQKQFSFYDDFEMLFKVVLDDLDAFQSMKKQDKVHWRQQAINAIEKKFSDNRKVDVVAERLMFWFEKQKEERTIYTINDLKRYIHIFFTWTLLSRLLYNIEWMTLKRIVRLCRWLI